MKRVLFFGTFDPIHAGHKDAFFQAKSYGDSLTVVVARDSTIIATKNHIPHVSESERLAAVAAISVVDTAMLGESDAHSYELLKKIPFDILALGYDQSPSDEEVVSLLAEHNLSHVQVVRLRPYLPEVHKSSLLRAS